MALGSRFLFMLFPSLEQRVIEQVIEQVIMDDFIEAIVQFASDHDWSLQDSIFLYLMAVYI